MSTMQSTQPITQAQPSRDTLRLASLVFVALALLISGYLSYVKLSEVPIVCVQNSSVFNCEVVQNSVYSRIAGVPIAYLGFVVNLIMGFLLVFENRIGFLKENGVMLVFGIALFAFLYSVYLVYLQFFVLKALCPWCLSHEVVITLLFVTSILRLRKSLRG
jgi:uncharacterized membrane protein